MKRKSEKYGSRRHKIKTKGGKGAEEDRERKTEEEQRNRRKDQKWY